MLRTRAIVGAAFLIAISTTNAAGPTATYSASDAIDLLVAGNIRFVSGEVEHRNAGMDRVLATAGGQSPFAIVLSCADSRVPVELVFDRGVGDLFVVRVAGNVSGVHEAGSIEYAVEHLGVPALVVMGHTQCGAVKAACEAGGAANEEHGPPGNVAQLVACITPAVAEARREGASGADLLGMAVRANVMRSMEDLLESSPVLSSAVSAGRLSVVGAVYDIGTGKVEWLGEHPRLEEILHGSIVGDVGEAHGQKSPGHEDEFDPTAEFARPRGAERAGGATQGRNAASGGAAEIKAARAEARGSEKKPEAKPAKPETKSAHGDDGHEHH